jgi:hypothetical protein
MYVIKKEIILFNTIFILYGKISQYVLVYWYELQKYKKEKRDLIEFSMFSFLSYIIIVEYLEIYL